MMNFETRLCGEINNNQTKPTTYDECKELALKFKYKSDFKKEHLSVHTLSIKNGWWDDITSHMVRKPINLKFDGIDLLSEVRKYTSRTDLFENGGGLYNYINKNNLNYVIDEVFPSIRVENRKLLLDNKKKCSRCNEIFDLTNFDLNSTKDVDKGYRSRCKKCFFENTKEYWAENREKHLKDDGRVSKQKLLSEGKKKCTYCNEIKELDGNFYYKKSDNKYQSKCNDCMVHYRRKLKPLTKEMELRYSLHEQQLKKCPTCQIVKSYSDYGVNKKAFGGIAGLCKICKSERDKQYREDPKHRQKNLDRKKDYYERTKDTERHKENERRNRERRDYKVEYERNRSDEFRRFRQNIRQLTNVHIKKRKDWVKKDSKTNDLLGADYFVVKEFIGRQFLKGMTWDNHGEVWHIDHVIPLDSADRDPDKLKRLCYYENLSPMWREDNLKKGHKVPNVCTLWENPIVPYKVNDLVIVPEHNGIVGRYKLQIEPGTKYGMLTVLSDGKTKEYKDRDDVRMMTCECDCGVIKDVRLNTLRTGATKSCGCSQRKMASENVNRKMNFTNEELMELADYVREHPKGQRLSEDMVLKYEGRTKKQIQQIIRSIRNKKLKKMELLFNHSSVEETI